MKKNLNNKSQLLISALNCFLVVLFANRSNQLCGSFFTLRNSYFISASLFIHKIHQKLFSIAQSAIAIANYCLVHVMRCAIFTLQNVNKKILTKKLNLYGFRRKKMKIKATLRIKH